MPRRYSLPVTVYLPGLDGRNVRLSGLDNKLIMLYFWSSTMAEQKMFNLDTLIPLYEEFHGRGFEIFAVSLDTDKTAWASTVRTQNLPWINVCDIRACSLPTSVYMAWGSYLRPGSSWTVRWIPMRRYVTLLLCGNT